MINKHGIGIILSSLALTAASVAWAPTAQAHTAQNCTGREDITYGSGLGLSSETTTVTVDGIYRCTDGSGHTTTAKYRSTGTTPATCLLLASNKATETLHFADGSRTVIDYNSGTSLRILGLNTAKLHGVVVDGQGRGSVAEKIIQTVPTSLPTDCVLTGGIRHTIAFTHLSIRPNP
ncbi:hypothetical protein [Streptomyces sp. YS-3]|uniref:hypothetical protein n=1 Tax=Streptomyces sp. YS-3 TaxID=3381352 RepID=UPI0038625662